LTEAVKAAPSFISSPERTWRMSDSYRRELPATIKAAIAEVRLEGKTGSVG
jgi:hypothetical protein